ncbi:putative membrane protein YphA (DoxX/SURF4 family) [Arthrobacter psychrochitiniphilus]|nr:DoxX family protein [Arthrobacter psychrochitiniphilus]NYG18286.1 putative membrane protein YphA (DoxX/SURF4 family) [Arthrobacter psychrochitiniphilus]
MSLPRAGTGRPRKADSTTKEASLSIIRAIARPMLASSFIFSGLDRLRHAETTAKQLSPVLGPLSAALPLDVSEKTLARALAAAQVGAGVLLAAGKFSRPAAVVLALTAGLSTVVEYRNANTDTKENRAHRRNQLSSNIALIGGALLASMDTEGRPGLAWRTEKLLASGKKNAKTQLKNADKQVRALAHDVTGQ